MSYLVTFSVLHWGASDVSLLHYNNISLTMQMGSVMWLHQWSTLLAISVEALGFKENLTIHVSISSNSRFRPLLSYGNSPQ